MITLTNLTKKKAPSIEWQLICEEILGKKYKLSVVIAGSNLMEKTNSRYRNKKEPAKVLSFSYSKNDGEIFLNEKYDKNTIFELFIHGLLHLKGYKHSKKMEVLEKSIAKNLKTKKSGRQEKKIPQKLA